MGGGGSRASVVAASVVGNVAAEAGPRPEDIVFEKIVTSIPQILKSANNKKATFVRFCHDTWIPQRKTMLDALEDAAAKYEEQQKICSLCEQLRLLNFCFKVLVLILSFYYSAGLLVALLVISFGEDFLRIYHQSEAEKIREKIRALSPMLENDRISTEKAKILWNEFDSKFMELKEEIDDFVKNVKYNFMEVETKTPGLKRFFQRIRLVKAKDKDDARKFFDAFLELIHNFNSAKSIYNNVRRGTKADTSYDNFVDCCKSTGGQISYYLEDLNFCYSEMKVIDASKMSFDVAVGKFREVPKKLQQMREVLDKNRENIEKKISGVNLKCPL